MQLFKDSMANILKLISDGHMKVGDKLPSEREMAETFGVSRVPVREAIKILEYLEILEIEPGDGIYVRNLPEDSADLSMSLIARTEDSLLELNDMRALLESYASYSAAQKRDENDIKALENIVAETKKMIKLVDNCKDEELLESYENDIREVSHLFHTAVIHAAHNSVLSSIYKSLYKALEVSKLLTVVSTYDNYASAKSHEKICKEIVAGNADRARDLMLAHMDETRAKIIKIVGRK